ncbi:hypothetical protein ASE63_05375 [Bosea sp. Root381]|nr:hypothetical protein ASE63_05375 [Bosea sp. Root381]
MKNAVTAVESLEQPIAALLRLSSLTSDSLDRWMSWEEHRGEVPDGADVVTVSMPPDAFDNLHFLATETRQRLASMKADIDRALALCVEDRVK